MSSKTKLFVANLSSRADKRDLEEKFEKYGKVAEIKIREGRDRDYFAFVEYEDGEDAEHAVSKMQGQEFFGKKIRIEFANGGKKREDRGDRRDRDRGGDRRDRDRNDRDRGDRSKKETTECFVCKETGHWANECPNGAGQGIKKGTCFVCGSTKHR